MAAPRSWTATSRRTRRAWRSRRQHAAATSSACRAQTSVAAQVRNVVPSLVVEKHAVHEEEGGADACLIGALILVERLQDSGEGAHLERGHRGGLLGVALDRGVDLGGRLVRFDGFGERGARAGERLAKRRGVLLRLVEDGLHGLLLILPELEIAVEELHSRERVGVGSLARARAAAAASPASAAAPLRVGER